MPRKCAVTVCESGRGRKSVTANGTPINFFSFPDPVTEKDRFNNFCRLCFTSAETADTDLSLSRLFICSLHFTSDDISGNRWLKPVLKKSALPCKNLPAATVPHTQTVSNAELQEDNDELVANDGLTFADLMTSVVLPEGWCARQCNDCAVFFELTIAELKPVIVRSVTVDCHLRTTVYVGGILTSMRHQSPLCTIDDVHSLLSTVSSVPPSTSSNIAKLVELLDETIVAQEQDNHSLEPCALDVEHNYAVGISSAGSQNIVGVGNGDRSQCLKVLKCLRSQCLLLSVTTASHKRMDMTADGVVTKKQDDSCETTPIEIFPLEEVELEPDDDDLPEVSEEVCRDDRSTAAGCYKCDMCTETFTSGISLARHIQTHIAASPFKCPRCCQLFSSKTSFVYHTCTKPINRSKAFLESSESTKRNCHVQNIPFLRRNQLDAHTHSQSVRKPYVCAVCEKTFWTSYSLKQHRYIHIGKKPYSCDICKRTFRDRHVLVVHRRRHTGEKPYKCRLCGKVFSSKDTLAGHTKTHSAFRPCVCDVCGKAFRRPAQLKCHLRIHSGERPYECHECKKTFSSSAGLITHRRVHTGKRPLRYSCDVCNKTFAHSSSRSLHKRSHTGEKPFGCDFCDKSLSNSSNRSLHNCLHQARERSYCCDVCGKTFVTSGGLTQHKRSHADEKPFSCDICNKSFSYQNSLYVHRQIHTGERPFICDICGKSFSLLSYLTVHKLVHAGERPFSCDVCGKTFTLKKRLNFHKRIHSR